MHIVDTNDKDLNAVAKLVNSNSGDWGYVTLVIQKGEKDTRRWQIVMDKMRRLHLIPIVRIASAPIGEVWEKPSVDEIDGWVSFLNSLNWVIKNRYVIIGNEVNHAKEWGGQINPGEYTNYLRTFSQKLKKESDNFFVLQAGFDASATNSKQSMDEANYIKSMLESDPNVFDSIDGWDSHSYPNPNFSGSADGVGKGSVRTYLWELDYIKTLGVTKNFPVFITETGWVHNSELATNIGPKLEMAFKNAWNNPKVIAVTPFIFNYSDPPFDIFSWVRKDGGIYDFYYTYQNLPKKAGEPIQETRGEIITDYFPTLGQPNQSYQALVFAKNTGQSIWNKNNFSIKPASNEDAQIDSVFPDVTEPQETAIIVLKGHFPAATGPHPNELALTYKNIYIGNALKFGVNITPTLPRLLDVVTTFVKFVLNRIKG